MRAGVPLDTPVDDAGAALAIDKPKRHGVIKPIAVARVAVEWGFIVTFCQMHTPYAAVEAGCWKYDEPALFRADALLGAPKIISHRKSLFTFRWEDHIEQPTRDRSSTSYGDHPTPSSHPRSCRTDLEVEGCSPSYMRDLPCRFPLAASQNNPFGHPFYLRSVRSTRWKKNGTSSPASKQDQ